MWNFRSSASRSARLGCLPTTPPLTDGPATNRHEAAPWSVPRLPFSCTRRPNSEKVISRTRPSWPVVFNVWKKRADRVGQVGQQVVVRGALVGVGVEAVEADVEDARAEALGDQAGDQLQLLAEAAALPRHGVRPFQQLAQVLDRRQRLHLPPLHERGQVVLPRLARPAPPGPPAAGGGPSAARPCRHPARGGTSSGR